MKNGLFYLWSLAVLVVTHLDQTPPLPPPPLPILTSSKYQ